MLSSKSVERIIHLMSADLARVYGEEKVARVLHYWVNAEDLWALQAAIAASPMSTMDPQGQLIQQFDRRHWQLIGGVMRERNVWLATVARPDQPLADRLERSFAAVVNGLVLFAPVAVVREQLIIEYDALDAIVTAKETA